MDISRSYLFPCPSPVWSLWVSSLSQTLPALVLSPNLKTLSHPPCDTDHTQSLAIWPSKTVPSSMPSCPTDWPQFPRKPQAELAAKSMEGFGHVVGHLGRRLAHCFLTWHFPLLNSGAQPYLSHPGLGNLLLWSHVQLGNPVLLDHRHCAYPMSVLP